MTKTSKRLLWAALIAALVFAATATVYIYGLPPAIASLWNRPVTEPAAVDYAVYSAFLDGYFLSNRADWAEKGLSDGSIVHVAADTLRMPNPDSILPLDVAALGPPDMGEDFFRQNAQPWHLHPEFHSRLKVSFSGRNSAVGVMRLSRIGLNRSGTLALLYYSHQNGELCCQSGWVVLRQTEGKWDIQQFGRRVLY